MTERYNTSYGERTPYAHVVELIGATSAPAGHVVADLGCGFGAIAEPIRALGLDYVGLDIEPSGLEELRRRGFAGFLFDLNQVEALAATIEEHLMGRRLAAITMLDVLEHLTNGSAVLRALCRLAIKHGGTPLVLSIPNVTHVDLAIKLLMGRWDVTPTGLLDETHVAFYSSERLRSFAAEAGWLCRGDSDFELLESDQRFPANASPLIDGTPLHEFLRAIRQRARPAAFVNQFVRLFVPIQNGPAREPELGNDGPVPWLSVLVRTQGRRPETLSETLLSLAAQTCSDFEVLLLAHDVTPADTEQLVRLLEMYPAEFSSRVRVIGVEGGGRARPLNVGASLARGEYLAVLDDDDVAFANWVETFQRQARESPGHVVRSIVARQPVRPVEWPDRAGYAVDGRPCCPWPAGFDLQAHLVENLTPVCGYATPRSCVADLGIEYNEALPVVEDWEFLMQAALVCGVSDTQVVTSLYRWWSEGASSGSAHPESEWEDARAQVIAELDRRPILFPKGSATAVRELRLTCRGVEADRDAIAKDRDEIFLDRDNIIADRAAVIADRDHLSEDLKDSRRVTEGLREDLAALVVHRDQLADALTRVEQEVRDIHVSTSWRATRPLRALGRVGRRRRT